MATRRPSYQMTTPEGAKFKRSVQSFLKKMGLTALPASSEWSSMYTHAVKTPAGKLFVDMDRVDTGTVFMRFNNPSKGKKCSYRSNPYSGKFNFHYGKVKATDAFSDFKLALSRVRSCKVGG